MNSRIRRPLLCCCSLPSVAPQQKLSQLPIGLPAQAVRALFKSAVTPASLHFSRLPHPPRSKNPTPSPMVYLQNVYRERSISTILQKNRGLRSLSAYGFMWQSILTLILTLMSHFHPVSPTPPHPARRALCHRTIPGEDL